MSDSINLDSPEYLNSVFPGPGGVFNPTIDKFPDLLDTIVFTRDKSFVAYSQHYNKLLRAIKEVQNLITIENSSSCPTAGIPFTSNGSVVNITQPTTVKINAAEFVGHVSNQHIVNNVASNSIDFEVIILNAPNPTYANQKQSTVIVNPRLKSLLDQNKCSVSIEPINKSVYQTSTNHNPGFLFYLGFYYSVIRTNGGYIVRGYLTDKSRANTCSEWTTHLRNINLVISSFST